MPYSGNIYPDGHTDHRGAWPADTYYGDIDGDNVVGISDLAELLGNYGTPSGASYEDGDLTGDGTAREFRLLHLLMSRPGQVLAPEAIARWVWGRGGDGSSPALRSAIYRLRRKIEEDPSHPVFIRTVWGKGYLFTPQGDRQE
mgnify:CR=1 FL=1